MVRSALISAAIALGLALIAAPAAEALANNLDDASLSAEIQKTRSDNPWQHVARLELLAKDKRLAKTQRATVLYRIALLYGGLAPDKPRAVATYQEMLKLDPMHPMAERARENIDYANTQMGHIRQRIEQGRGSVDDRMMMGDYETLINEMKSGQWPRQLAETEARNLYYAGWFCERPGGMPIGSTNTENLMVRPCETRQNPININPLRRL
jgi:hypothetical protein